MYLGDTTRFSTLSEHYRLVPYADACFEFFDYSACVVPAVLRWRVRVGPDGIPIMSPEVPELMISAEFGTRFKSTFLVPNGDILIAESKRHDVECASINAHDHPPYPKFGDVIFIDRNVAPAYRTPGRLYQSWNFEGPLWGAVPPGFSRPMDAVLCPPSPVAALVGATVPPLSPPKPIVASRQVLG